MLIHPVFKISSNTRVKLTSTVTDINVPRLVHIQHLFNHKDRAGLPSLRSGQAHRGSRLDRKAKIEKGADVGPFFNFGFPVETRTLVSLPSYASGTCPESAEGGQAHLSRGPVLVDF